MTTWMRMTGKMKTRRMKMTDKKRYFIIMVIGVLMNECLYGICRLVHAPFWLDTSGTGFAALMLEPAAGLIVGLINNFYLAITTGNSSNLLYFAVSAIPAIVIGVGMRNDDGQVVWKRMIPVFIILVVLETAISSPLSLWMDGGVLTTWWEQHVYGLAIGWGWSQTAAVWLATFLIKIPDTVATLAVIYGLYRVLPAKLHNDRDA